MKDSRYKELMILQRGLMLTSQEVEAGWHFCPSWDFLLVGQGMEELEYCECDTSKGRGVTVI